MIVLVGGEKGGTGKTTLAVNLAALRAIRGRDVLLVDTDPQGSASGWVLTRDEAEQSPRVASVQKFGRGIATDIQDLAKRYQDIIIDAGGRDSVELRMSMVMANVMVVPVQASQFDIWTLGRMSELVEQAKSFNANLKPMVLLSRAVTNHAVKDTDEAAQMIRDFENLQLCTSIVRDRIGYRRAAAAGLSVCEHTPPDQKAIAEIEQLYTEVFGHE